ncbi:hypothetical protein PR202_gb04272 [Eleusine coracana subsp. coracana]|uniref:F-box domain-containing protein n=1 Tax=Eleusine coracana subsp. coracana TaxID=191504 RepID=A0AAV5E461_ELECO|nr:hypothetical protein PR202_gb04272 [Eleusine coracana subsp. coracana]
MGIASGPWRVGNGHSGSASNLEETKLQTTPEGSAQNRPRNGPFRCNRTRSKGIALSHRAQDAATFQFGASGGSSRRFPKRASGARMSCRTSKRRRLSPHARPWASLPQDLVEQIGWRVLAGDLRDYVRFRAVCSHWKSSTACPRGRGLVDPRFHPRRWMMLPEDHGLYPCASSAAPRAPSSASTSHSSTITSFSTPSTVSSSCIATRTPPSASSTPSPAKSPSSHRC